MGSAETVYEEHSGSDGQCFERMGMASTSEKPARTARGVRVGADSSAFRKPAGVVAAVAVSLGTLFAGTPVSVADPYDGDDGGSSYDGGGDSGGVQEAPSSGGVEEPSG